MQQWAPSRDPDKQGSHVLVIQDCTQGRWGASFCLPSSVAVQGTTTNEAVHAVLLVYCVCWTSGLPHIVSKWNLAFVTLEKCVAFAIMWTLYHELLAKCRVYMMKVSNYQVIVGSKWTMLTWLFKLKGTKWQSNTYVHHINLNVL